MVCDLEPDHDGEAKWGGFSLRIVNAGCSVEKKGVE